MSDRPDKPDTPIRKYSFWETLVAIAWSFTGLRRKSDFDRDDAGAMNPIYVILAGLLGVALFIGVLILAVKFALA